MSLVYVSGLDRYVPLSREEEMEIALRYKEDKNERDAQKLITSNLRYVVRVANKFSIQHRDVDVSELIQEGSIGLMRALEKFEPEKGFKLITYANSWIHTYMQRFISKNNNMSSGATRHKHNQFFTSNLEGVEILDDIDMGSYEETNTKALQYKCCIEEKLAEKNWIKSVHLVLDDTNEKDRFIIENRLVSYDPIKLDEVAEHFKISRSGAHALEKRIKDRLKKKFMKSPDIIEFLGEDTITDNIEKETLRRKKKKIGHIIDDFDYDLIKELLQTETYKAVAEKMGISKSYLYTIINRKSKEK